MLLSLAVQPYRSLEHANARAKAAHVMMRKKLLRTIRLMVSQSVPQVHQVNRDSVSASCLSPAVCSGNISRDHIPPPYAETASGNIFQWKKKSAFKNGFRFFPPPEKIPSSDGLQHGSSFKRSPTLAAGLTEPTAGMRSVAYFHWDHCVGNPWQRLCSTF